MATIRAERLRWSWRDWVRIDFPVCCRHTGEVRPRSRVGVLCRNAEYTLWLVHVRDGLRVHDELRPNSRLLFHAGHLRSWSTNASADSTAASAGRPTSSLLSNRVSTFARTCFRISMPSMYVIQRHASRLFTLVRLRHDAVSHVAQRPCGQRILSSVLECIDLRSDADGPDLSGRHDDQLAVPNKRSQRTRHSDAGLLMCCQLHDDTELRGHPRSVFQRVFRGLANADANRAATAQSGTLSIVGHVGSLSGSF